MTNKTERSQKMLATALEMETRGMEFYEKAMKTCTNRVGREIFTKLRDDEVVHQDRIRKIHASLREGQAWNDEWKKMPAEGRSLSPIFRELAKKEGSKIRGETSDIEALDIGITFETKSVEYYQDHLKGAEDPLEREFLEQMILEEKSHYDLLVDMKYYLTDPDNWFAEKERIHMDGA
jgi:rubrerythrin